MQHHAYITRGEKIRDFAFGFLGLFVFSVLLSGMFLAAVLSKVVGADLSTFFFLCAFCLPPLASLIAVIYFALTRYWIALGIIAGFGFTFACAMLGYALLIGSGFSLV